MITFKQFIFEALDNTKAYELRLPDDAKLSVLENFHIEMYEYGVLWTRRLLVGTQQSLTTFVKKTGIASLMNIADKQLLGLIAPSADYVATKKSIPFKPEITLEYIAKQESIPYTVVYLERNKTNPRVYDALFIHEKRTPFEDLECITYPADLDFTSGLYTDKTTGRRIMPGMAMFYVIDADEKHEGDYTQNDSYKYLEDHFTEVTTDKQRKAGTLQFHLGKPQRAELIIVLNSGYVRKMVPGNTVLRVLHSPTGDTPEEKQNNALAAAVQWVKRNA